jgi:hypothetical protein
VLLLFRLSFRLLQADQGPPLLAISAEMHQNGDFVIRQIIEAGLHHDRIIALQLHGHALGLLIDGSDDPADSGRSSIAPLISGCGKRAALSIAG